MHTPIQSIHTSGHYMRRIQKVPKATLKKFTPATLLVMLAFSLVPNEDCFSAISSTWQGHFLTDNWSTSSEWDNGIPQNMDEIANLPENNGLDYIIDLDIPVTLGTLNFNTTGSSYVINPVSTNVLNFDATSDAPSITMNGNSVYSLTINCPMSIATGNSLSLTNNVVGDQLIITGVVSGPQMSANGPGGVNCNFQASNPSLLILDCSLGTLELGGTANILSAQTLKITNGTASFSNINQLFDGINPTGDIDLEGGQLNSVNNQTVDTFTFNGGTLLLSSSTLTIQTQLAMGSGVAIPSNGTVVLESGASVSYAGSFASSIHSNIDFGGGDPIFNIAPTGLTVDGTITNGGTIGLRKREEAPLP